MTPAPIEADGEDRDLATGYGSTGEDSPADVISLVGVDKYFHDKRAVAELDLSVPRGSICGLIGSNGAGKTTTLKMVATLIKPDKGTVHVCGHDLADSVATVRPLIGYMADAFGGFRGLSCEEYLQFFGRAYHLTGKELAERIDAVLALTDLQGLREELTTALSTGVRQRLALAKTLLHDPEVLILDEPASGLDPRARIEIRSLLRELRTMGKTILISSHILADLDEVCTDVAIIEQGRVVWSGSIEESHETGTRAMAIVTVNEDDVPAAMRAIDALKVVSKTVSLGGGRIEALIDVGQSNALLQSLLDVEIDVLSFRRQKRDLESLFLEQTRGIVS